MSFQRWNPTNVSMNVCVHTFCQVFSSSLSMDTVQDCVKLKECNFKPLILCDTCTVSKANVFAL